jgi:hypothetical protein
MGLFHNGLFVETQTFPTEGCIMGNCINGAGVYFWETHDLYIGEWRNGFRTGYGRYDWANGSWYIGTFKEGKLDGQGEYHPVDENVLKGTFVNGVFLER